MNKLLLYQHFFSFSFSQTFFISIATSSHRSKKIEPALSTVEGLISIFIPLFIPLIVS